ncbi:MAG: O-antigen ligase C-terminal domain-containing protein [Zoogloeaceae bacterium]|nr:O-antigen ligase C-terminal domain-containing protein [Zoogloeaceae bacterium]
MLLICSRISLASLLLALTLPFLGAHHRLPIATFHQEWLAATLGLTALLALVLGSTRNTGNTWAIPRLALLPLAFIVLAWLQFASGMDVLYESIVLLSLYLAWAFLLMLTAASLLQTLGRDLFASALAWSLLAGALLLAATGALQHWVTWIGLPYIFPSSTLIGNIAQANSFADYLWIGIACALYLFAIGKIPYPAALAAITPLLALSLLSGSRSVYFYAMALSIWLGLWAATAHGLMRRRLLLSAIGLLPLLFLVQWLSGLQGSSISSAQRLVEQGSYDPVRLTLWRAAIEIFLEQPLLGAGFDSFSRMFYARIQHFPINGAGIPEHSHNLLTELLAEFGLAGCLLLLVALIYWLIKLRPRSDTTKFLTLGILLIPGIHSMLEYPLWYAHFLAVAVVALSLGDDRPWLIHIGLRHRLMATAIVLAGLLTLFNLRTDYIELENAAQGHSYESRLISAEEQRESLLRIYTHSLLRPYAALQFAARMPIESQDLKLRIELMREARHFSPIRQALFREAALLQLDGQQEAARQQLQQAMRSYPNEIPATLRLFRELEQSEPALAPLIAQLDQRSF